MKPWIRKFSVIFITILTLGLYTPPFHVDTEAAEKNASTPKKNIHDDSVTSKSIADTHPDQELTIDYDDSVVTNQDYIDGLTAAAIEQMYTKMGPRIMNKVEEEITTVILPGIEDTVESIMEREEEQIPYYEITVDSTGGYGERIFHLVNNRTHEEVARFDVRRVNRPGEGHWFHFHYHLKEDNFEKHYTIGEVYWDKNTPPKWMS